MVMPPVASTFPHWQASPAASASLLVWLPFSNSSTFVPEGSSATSGATP